MTATWVKIIQEKNVNVVSYVSDVTSSIWSCWTLCCVPGWSWWQAWRWWWLTCCACPRPDHTVHAVHHQHNTRSCHNFHQTQYFIRDIWSLCRDSFAVSHIISHRYYNTDDWRPQKSSQPAFKPKNPLGYSSFLRSICHHHQYSWFVREPSLHCNPRHHQRQKMLASHGWCPMFVCSNCSVSVERWMLPLL